MKAQKGQLRKFIVLGAALALLFVLLLGNMTGFAASYTAKKANDGNVYLYADGRVDTSYTGIFRGNKYTMYFTNGALDTSVTGLVENEDGEYLYFVNGYQKTSYTGIYRENENTVYIKRGVLDTSRTGLVKDENGEYLYFVNGYQQTNYTGPYKGNKYTMYIKEGVFYTSINELVKDAEGNWLYFADGYWKSSFTGFYTSKNNGRTFYIKRGVWQSGRTELLKNADGNWAYVKGGVWQESYTGFYTSAINGKTFYIYRGVWQSGRTELLKNAEGKWAYVKDGLWQENFTGLYASANNGTIFYIADGVWDTTYADLYKQDGISYYVSGGKVQNDLNGAKTISGVTYQFVNGIATPVHDALTARFLLMSDTHILYNSVDSEFAGYLRNALTESSNYVSQPDAVVINGDLTNNGSEGQYSTLRSVLSTYSPTDNIYTIMGNHDTGTYFTEAGYSTAFSRWKKYMGDFAGRSGASVPYYDKWVNGYHFIFMSTEGEEQNYMYISNTQLSWLESKLAENASRNKPIFVFCHNPIYGTHAISDTHGEHIGNQSSAVKNIIAKYPQTIFISGHSHNGLGYGDYYISNSNGHFLAVPALIRNNRGLTDSGILWYVEVWGDRVEFKARDSLNHKWLSQYNVTVQYI